MFSHQLESLESRALLSGSPLYRAPGASHDLHRAAAVIVSEPTDDSDGGMYSFVGGPDDATYEQEDRPAGASRGAQRAAAAHHVQSGTPATEQITRRWHHRASKALHASTGSSARHTHAESATPRHPAS